MKEYFECMNCQKVTNGRDIIRYHFTYKCMTGGEYYTSKLLCKECWDKRKKEDR